MKKIRINVLARELEVKSHLILELLPDLGVSEKLTHSSSIDDDVADKLRVRFGIAPGGNGDRGAEHDFESGADQHGIAVEEPPTAAPAEEEKRETARPASHQDAPPAAPPQHAEAPVEHPTAEPAPARPGPAAPIRPPIAAQPPPGPDLVTRLSQPKAPLPGQPAAPRPGVPIRQQGAPVPGQPIYKGPVRTGAPMAPRPGMRTGAPMGRPMGPRPMHPTSRSPLGV